MDARLVIKDSDGININNIEDIKDKYNLYYRDDFEGDNYIQIFDDRLTIKRSDKEHTTFLSLSADLGYVNVETNEGTFKIDLKIVAFNIKDDMITIAYKIGEDLKEITINYLGV